MIFYTSTPLLLRFLTQPFIHSLQRVKLLGPLQRGASCMVWPVCRATSNGTISSGEIVSWKQNLAFTLVSRYYIFNFLHQFITNISIPLEKYINNKNLWDIWATVGCGYFITPHIEKLWFLVFLPGGKRCCLIPTQQRQYKNVSCLIS